MVVDIAFELLFVVSFFSNIILLYTIYLFWDDAARSRSELDQFKNKYTEYKLFDDWSGDDYK